MIPRTTALRQKPSSALPHRPGEAEMRRGGVLGIPDHNREDR